MFEWRYNQLRSSDHRDLDAFFHSASIEAAYQKGAAAYEAYLETQLDEAEEDDDYDPYYDDDDDWYGWDDDDDTVYPPLDKRAVYLSQYIHPFEDVLKRHDFQLKFPEVPAVVWDRYESRS